MTRAEITKLLSELTIKHINPHNDPRIYWAKEVTFDYGTLQQCRVDFMQFKPVNNSVSGIEHGDFYCYEIKSSEDDYRSKHGHNLIGDYNYYVMPFDVYCRVKDTIPWNVGVLCPVQRFSKLDDASKVPRPDEDWDYLKSQKGAHRADRTKSLAEMLLMMFRSCARDRRREENLTDGTHEMQV